MKKQQDSGNKVPVDVPDIRKVEKKIQTENRKKITEVPEVPDEEPSKKSPEEMPERKEDNEVDTGKDR